LKCGLCGSNVVPISGRGGVGWAKYGCPLHQNRGICSNALVVRRDSIEREIIEGLQREVLRDFVVACALDGCLAVRVLRPSALPFRMVCGSLDGMTIKIDKAGRIVLPKPVRERFHLREGSELELEERSDGLTLRLVEQRSSMVQEKGIWVHLGKVPRGFDWDSVVEAIRDERIKDASGI